jgi:hypothetical protein
MARLRSEMKGSLLSILLTFRISKVARKITYEKNKNLYRDQCDDV